jgi:hypothetical protein
MSHWVGVVVAARGTSVPNVVQTDGFHLFEVTLNDPCLPMILQHAQGGLVVLHLSKRVFVDDIIVSRVLKDTRRYPRLDYIG